MEALKEAHGLETDRMTAELARTHEVSCRCRQTSELPDLLPDSHLLKHLDSLYSAQRKPFVELSAEQRGALFCFTSGLSTSYPHLRRLTMSTADCPRLIQVCKGKYMPGLHAGAE